MAELKRRAEEAAGIYAPAKQERGLARYSQLALRA